MEPAQAAAELATIRTLMERAALYRRALAPMTLVVGALGTLSSGVGLGWPMTTSSGFAAQWVLAAVVALVAAFLVVRRQSLQAAEPLWTPPTRRVFAALAPSVFLGAVVAAPALFDVGATAPSPLSLTAAWMALYGLGLNAAGFFMPRGIRWFGFAFAAAAGLLVLARSWLPALNDTVQAANLLMGLTFGLGHLAYGIYLRATEHAVAPVSGAAATRRS